MEHCKNDLEMLRKDYEILEQKFAEKSFKFWPLTKLLKLLQKKKVSPL